MNAIKGMGFIYTGFASFLYGLYLNRTPGAALAFFFKKSTNPGLTFHIIAIILCIIGTLLIIDTGMKDKARKEKAQKEYEEKYKQ